MLSDNIVIMNNIPRKRILLFDMLRGFAVIPIYCYHQQLFGGRVYAWCVWGVTTFLIMSGFLSTVHGYEREYSPLFKSSIEYAFKKIKRLFPLHVFMLTVICICFMISSHEAVMNDPAEFFSGNAIKFLLNLFLVSDWIPHIKQLSAINGEYNIVTWYLSLTLLLYLFTPFFFKCMRHVYRSRKKYVPYIVMVILYAYVIIFDLSMRRMLGRVDSFWYEYECALSRVTDYLIGCQLGYMYLNRDIYGVEPKRTGRIMLYISVVLSVLLIGYGTFFIKDQLISDISSGYYYTIPVGMMIFAMALIDETAGEPVTNKRILKPLMQLGDLSPFIYLTHYPMIVLVHGVLVLIGNVNHMIWFAVAALLTAGTAVLYREILNMPNQKKTKG